jgi:uncharacterized protein (TIGR02757 family)
MTLKPTLERLIAQTDVRARMRTDPIHFVRPYADRPRDAEIAGVFASQLAYGRVSSFRPVLEDLFGRLDDAGGPRAFVEDYHPDDARAQLAGLQYRFNRPVDFVGMTAALSCVLNQHGTLASAFAAPDAAASLTRGVGALRQAAVATSESWMGSRAKGHKDLPAGLRYWLSTPQNGSACKRWNLFLRWMVRPTTEGIDLGLWPAPRPSGLVIPLDTHVHRLAGFLGLTHRGTANWRTAEQITAALRQLDPQDPVRFDFALAHLGISGACRGGRDPAICPACPLDPLCTADPISRN